jgi:hypothetical protein
MADAEQLARIRRSVEEWNAWRKENPLVVADFTEADLHGADLQKAQLIEADLFNADLQGADLQGADLILANLYEANLRYAKLIRAHLGSAQLVKADLSGADLQGADLREANLWRANLREAYLDGAQLIETNLDSANLAGAAIRETLFVDVTLKGVVGLDSCCHHGPSVIDHRTLIRSWPLPELFLRGCGLPDTLIKYLPSLLSAGAIQFYSCFISYSVKDQEFVNRLYADLQNKGVRCWFAPHDVQGGKKLHEQIDEAIRKYERLLLIVSPNSMDSAWVETEIRNARRRERTEKRRVLFPVRLVSYDALRDWKLFDADEGRDLATEIREYYIPDFSEWNSHDLYQKEFEKLLRDLRIDGTK